MAYCRFEASCMETDSSLCPVDCPLDGHRSFLSRSIFLLYITAYPTLNAPCLEKRLCKLHFDWQRRFSSIITLHHLTRIQAWQAPLHSACESPFVRETYIMRNNMSTTAPYILWAPASSAPPSPVLRSTKSFPRPPPPLPIWLLLPPF